MNLLLIAKSESQLAEQGESLRTKYSTAQIKTMAHDFSSHKVRLYSICRSVFKLYSYYTC
jgi:hypothetical protein